MTPDHLQSRFPGLDPGLPRVRLASLPTPVRECRIDVNGKRSTAWIKADDCTSAIYGGNKVRKLEYLFGSIGARTIDRVATYGTVASNHAIATAIFARQLGYATTCFLAHQTKTALARAALNMHVRTGSEIVVFGGGRATRIAAQRQYLWHRRAAVIPAGGSSWIGTAGFVNAGLELADQVDAGVLPAPDRIYIASGTLGSAAGLAIGLAIAGLDARVDAVRVSHPSICNEALLERLMRKTCLMLNRIDDAFPVAAWRRARITLRHEFFGPGYAKGTTETDAAIRIAKECGLSLETTYTGKAMAALLDDRAGCADRGERQLFWNTYHSQPLPVRYDVAEAPSALPGPFRSYFD
jgi:1-aminocyclopropane-1-carboxylate deaminase/D-cysteine desulfhydrase-like pyridoxal-dependent ACC family enzyme